MRATPYRRWVTVAPALVASAVLAATANAAPTVTTDRQCYAEDMDLMTFNGGGFTPGAPIGLVFTKVPVGVGPIGTYDTTADPSGAFTTRLRAPTLEQFKATPPRFQLSITANDQSLLGPDGPVGPPENTFAAATATITAWDVDVPAWDTNGPAKARVGQQLPLRTVGWTSHGKVLYAHYLRGSKEVRAWRVGALKAPCGDLTTTFTAFPWKAKPGTYRVEFSTTRRWDPSALWMGYKAVRVK